MNYKFKKGEIKFFIDNNGKINKGEIVGMTTYKKEISNKKTDGKKQIIDINLYFIQTGDFIKYIGSEKIIFEKEEDKIYDTKIECFKLLDNTK